MPTRKKSAAKSPAFRGRASMSRATTVEEYLAGVPSESRVALNKLRKMVKSAAPKATEGISYGVPMFKHNGMGLVSLGAGAAHCAFYVMSPEVMRRHAAALKGYEVGKGSIRFPADKPLPATLVTKLVKARIAEVEKGAAY
jgi:uncharacterized protein YdhG (YjbR/CyaY superfamily)